jgi:hypothetical protein
LHAAKLSHRELTTTTTSNFIDNSIINNNNLAFADTEE